MHKSGLVFFVLVNLPIMLKRIDSMMEYILLVQENRLVRWQISYAHAHIVRTLKLKRGQKNLGGASQWDSKCVAQ